MAFHLDPSIILHQPDQGDPDRALQSGMTLGSMLRQRQRENSLADIYRQSAGANPRDLYAALMKGGFGQEAYAAQEQQAQMALRDAQGRKALQDALESGEKIFRGLVGNVKDQAGWDQVRANAPAHIKSLLPQQWDPAWAETYGMDPDDRARFKQQGAALAETKRHNQEMEKRPPGTQIVLQGADGTQYLQPASGGPAKTAVDDKGNPIVRPPPAKSPRPLNKSDRDTLDTFRGQAETSGDLLNRFQDSYAGKGIVGSAGVEFNQKLGSMASPEGQAEAAFWADFAKHVDLPERNKTFGSSLTATEKASWDNAKNIKPGADPKIVREQLAKMQKIAADAMARRARSLVKDGYSAEAIEELTGPLGAAGQPAPSGTGNFNLDDRGPAPKTVTGYRWNKNRTQRIPVYSDGTQGKPEAVAK